MNLQTFLTLLLLIGLLMVVEGCVEEETGDETELLEKTGYERPREGEQEGKLGLSFVEGDSDSWHVQSSKMGEYILSPSWFRFGYESGINELPPMISCKQFGSLEDAKNMNNPLSKVIKEYAGKEQESYTLIFSEKGMEETLVEINIAISNFPPNGYVIYKYGAAEPPAEKSKETMEEEPISEPKGIEAREEKALSQEEKEIVEFLEAEDEQFDYPAVNRILADFRIGYFYYLSENSFTNGEVNGIRHLETDVRNLADGSREPIKGLGATFTTDLIADNWRKEELIKMGPPVYVWAYDDVPAEEFHEAVFRPESLMEFPNQLVSFTPGFDASRSADKTVFLAPDIQTLTITVIPREKNIEEKADGIGMCIYTIEPGRENLVDAVIVSSTSEEYVEISEDKHSLRVSNVPVKTNTPWSITLTIEVTPKPGVSKVEFLPFVSVLWNPSSFIDTIPKDSCIMEGDTFSKGNINGSSVSCIVDELGTWKWKAKGNYIWEWVSTPGSHYLIAFEHQQKRRL